MFSNLIFLKKGMEIVSQPYFMYDFWRKPIMMLHSINWPNFISLMSLLIEILGSLCIVIFYWDIGQYVYCNCLFPRLGSLKFEVNVTLLIKSFFYLNKMSRQKWWAFKLKWIVFFIIFKRSSLPKIVSDLIVPL